MEQAPLAGADGPPSMTVDYSTDTAPSRRAGTPAEPAPAEPAGPEERLPVYRRLPGWLLVALIYLALAVGTWWHVWFGGHPGSTMTADWGDPSSFVWFLEWPAYAISHGHSLFLATRDQVPGGMNMLDNTSVLAIGVVLSPVTWLFGPVASLNVALTAAPFLSALSAYGCLRRGLNLWRPAAFLAGLLFGFSPFVQRNQTLGHLQVTFLALIPLIFLCCYELTVTQRGKWWRSGLLLGLLVTVQFFIGTEILTMVTLTITGSIVLALIVAAVVRRGELAARLPFAIKGLALGAVIGAVLLAYPVHFAMKGPDHITGSDWAQVSTNSLKRILFNIAEPHGAVARLPYGGYLGPSGLSGGYIGLVAVLVLIAAVIFVRRPLVWLLAVVAAMAAWASLGAYGKIGGFHGALTWLPSVWKLVKNMPVLDQATPQNFSAVLVFAVAVSAGLLVDWIWRHWSGNPVTVASLAAPRALLAGGVAIVISLGLILPWALDWPMPYTTESVATPASVSRVFATIPSSAVVLFYPFPSSAYDEGLVWQAQDSMRFRVVGGRGITAGPGGAAVHGLAPGTPAGMLSALSTIYTPHGNLALPPLPSASVIASMRQAMQHWEVTNIVMLGGGRAPDYARQWLTKVLGQAPHQQDGRWVWTNVQQLLAS